MASKMNTEAKGKLISAILIHMEFAYRNKLSGLSAWEQRSVKPFDRGDTFFMLAFCTDAELHKIAKLAGL